MVIGAGFAGATLARILADSGEKVLVVDKRCHIGGISYDYKDENGITDCAVEDFMLELRDEIGNMEFLQSIELAGNSSIFSIREGCLYAKKSGTLLYIPQNSAMTKLTPSSTQRLSRWSRYTASWLCSSASVCSSFMTSPPSVPCRTAL